MKVLYVTLSFGISNDSTLYVCTAQLSSQFSQLSNSFLITSKAMGNNSDILPTIMNNKIPLQKTFFAASLFSSGRPIHGGLIPPKTMKSPLFSYDTEYN